MLVPFFVFEENYYKAAHSALSIHFMCCGIPSVAFTLSVGAVTVTEASHKIK